MLKIAVLRGTLGYIIRVKKKQQRQKPNQKELCVCLLSTN
jgi:hypothetical protein